MKATKLAQRRVVLSETRFAEIVVWHVANPVPGSAHSFKYRLAYVVIGDCVLRYDNEAGKGDHRHAGGAERAYRVESVEKLMADFERDIARWQDENRDA